MEPVGLIGGIPANSERLAARLRLSKLDAYEHVACRLDAAASEGATEVALTTLFWREQLARQYQRLVGCEFQERAEVRTKLLRVLGCQEQGPAQAKGEASSSDV